MRFWETLEIWGFEKSGIVEEITRNRVKIREEVKLLIKTREYLTRFCRKSTDLGFWFRRGRREELCFRVLSFCLSVRWTDARK